MNFASWVILAIVVAVLALAVRATFFKRKSGGCCGGHDDAKGPRGNATEAAGCSGCSGKSCETCAVWSTMLQPRIIPLDPPSRD